MLCVAYKSSVTFDIRTGTATANGLEIAYEDMGTVDVPSVVLIMGFACQLTAWPLNFCRLLVDAGYRVIRFDNRDIGLSTKFDGVRLEEVAIAEGEGEAPGSA